MTLARPIRSKGACLGRKGPRATCTGLSLSVYGVLNDGGHGAGDCVAALKEGEVRMMHRPLR